LFLPYGRNPLTVGRRALPAPTIDSNRKTLLDSSFDSFKRTFNSESILYSSVALRARTFDMDLVGDTFSLYNDISANNIIRLNSDGSKDTSFVYDSGFNDIIMSVIEDSSNKYVVCGSYNLYGATSSNSIIRLNSNGSIDTTFNIGSGFNVSSYNQ
jgi:hypothetical protein